MKRSTHVSHVPPREGPQVRAGIALITALVAICLQDRDRPMLEAHAVAWYQDHLSQAI